MTRQSDRFVRPVRRLALCALIGAAACAGESVDAKAGEAEGAGARSTATQPSPSRPVIDRLAKGEAVFGIFSGDHTAEQGAQLLRSAAPDFVFYSLEEGPFDMPAMESYMGGMRDAGSEGPPPVALRIPPIRDDHEAAREHVRQGLASGAAAIVYPHVENAAEAALAVSAMGDDVWPGNQNGGLLTVLIIEDQAGVKQAREIVQTPGVGVVIPGPGDLRRAYDGDMEAVENAIQTVLAACKEYRVPCGITAGVDDVAERLTQGFRFFISNGT